ncbi:MAG: hypothetical protein ACI8O8_002153 [Oleiphilaceae bacterium]|jgi:hypothetical protein
MKVFSKLLASLVLLVASTLSQAFVLDFDPSINEGTCGTIICSNGRAIDKSYGYLVGSDAWFVGIDNINYDVELLSLSDPGTLALLGLGLMGHVLRRRRSGKV